MKITYLDFDDIKNPLLGAGQGRATHFVGRELTKLGHEVTVISSKYPNSVDRTDNGIIYKHIGLGSGNIQLNNAAYILSLPFSVRKINKENTDIVIECFTAPISTLFSPLFTKVPVVALPSMFNAKAFSKKYHLPFDLIEKFGAKLYKYMLPYSDTDANKMKSLNPKIIYKIIGQGVGLEFFNVKAKKPKHILFFGRLDVNQKGIDLLLEAYSKIKDKVGFPLVIAGHGPDRQKVVELITKYDLEKSVTPAGFVDGEKKNKLFSEAIFAVFPSRHDEISLGNLEELAAGLPLVAFDLPESKWLSDKVSVKVKPYDVDAYAGAIKNLTSNKKLAGMKKQCKIFAKKYRWENVARDFEFFFIEILERGSK